MKTIFLFLIFSISYCIGNCQIISDNQPNSTSKKLSSFYSEFQLDSVAFNNILKREFNAVINSSGRTTIGNYASADIKDGKVAFNATKNFKNGDMLSINASGGITDGFFAIFNQTKINSNVGINFKYNFRLRSSSISFYTDEIEKLKKKINDAKAETSISQTINVHDSILLRRKIALLANEIKAIDSKLQDVGSNPERKADLEYQLALKTFQKDSLLLKQQMFPSLKEADQKIKNAEQKAKAKALLEFEYTGISFQWISLGGGLSNNNFNQFLPRFSSLDSQIVKQNNIVWNMTIEYNLYKWNHYSKPTYYLLIGFKGSVDDNFADLTKVEINDTNLYGSSLNQRSTIKKFNAYKGDYQTKILAAKFYADYYKFFFKNEAAIHIYPEANFTQNSKPIYNAGIGLLYSFYDMKDKETKAKLNAELYFRLSDLSNNSESKLKTFQRNELGLRLSIPISFLNF
ncbi:hypothetical protein [Pedobacter soli]|uniref:Uncharacterized protein n=1 Tax=Pedobacter soli TaxID=390242 RepID=A0A1G6Y6A5_9SPHI|nr:hypothetical protein [Pedobacter soli]SDD85949.1 hypothetical protein SAMN04488024_108174 [Pedobacter soli]